MNGNLEELNFLNLFPDVSTQPSTQRPVNGEKKSFFLKILQCSFKYTTSMPNLYIVKARAKYVVNARENSEQL